MKINEKTLGRINQLKEDIELYLSDYGIWGKKEFELDTEVYDDAIEVELTLNLNYNDRKPIYLFFKISEEETKLMTGPDREYEEEVDGEHLWRALFFDIV